MHKTEIAIIGSGPGGSLTAALLAEAGKQVILIERGKHLSLTSCEPFSQEEMIQKYRNSGLTVAFGNPKISYVEGSCVGGGSEVNSALYFRTPSNVLANWRENYKVAGLEEGLLNPYFEMNERELSIGYMPPDKLSPASLKLHEGAQALGWESMEVPRWYQYNKEGIDVKQSMTETMIPRAIAAGAIIKSGVNISKIIQDGNEWIIQGTENIRAKTVFLCGGATSTPQLLLRSKLSKKAGKTLHMHPTIKMVAKFPEVVNDSSMGVPVHQVKEFSPRFSFGCSISSYPYLALAMMDVANGLEIVKKNWQHMAIYYSMVTAGSGTVSNTFLGQDPVVKYHLGKQGFIDTLDGMEKLGECLFEAGAEEIYPAVANSRPIKNLTELKIFKAELLKSSPARLNLMTIHLFSSCPMGEDLSKCVVDSFGKLHGYDNLYINDSSMLCGPLGVNPQGTIMAIARRNIDHFLKRGNKMIEAIVTGASGWLGKALVNALINGISELPELPVIDKNNRLRVLVLPSESTEFFQTFGDRIEIIRGDVCNPQDCEKLLQGCENAILYHTVGVIHPKKVKDFYDVNLEGTKNILAAAEKNKIKRAVIVSSNSPIGCNPTNDHLFNEESAYNPYMGYGRSKMQMELFVKEFQKKGTVETVLIRAPWFYGVFQPPRQTLFFQMIKDGKCPVVGDGQNMRSMAYVENLAQGLILAGHTPIANGKIYWIADEKPYSMNEIIDTIEDVLRKDFNITCAGKRMTMPNLASEIAFHVDRVMQSLGLYNQKIHVLSEMNKSIACSVDLAKKELGYKPTVALREGMRRSIQSIIEQGVQI